MGHIKFRFHCSKHKRIFCHAIFHYKKSEELFPTTQKSLRDIFLRNFRLNIIKRAMCENSLSFGTIASYKIVRTDDGKTEAKI